MNKPIRLGTRGSDLARWQTAHVQALLATAWPDREFESQVFSTRGDQLIDQPLPQIAGKGVFTAELEAALREGVIDLAVHSLKDLPTEDAPGLRIGAVTQRANVADALVSRAGLHLDALPEGASVGTSSTRRAAQLRQQRPDLKIIDLRGNVPTRVRKALDPDGPYDAIILAYAGLERLDMLDAISETLSFEVMLPAPGQGALAVQCRDDPAWLDRLWDAAANFDSAYATAAERGFLAGLGGGCAVPVAAYAWRDDAGKWTLRGRVLSPDGAQVIDLTQRWTIPLSALAEGDLSDHAARIGAELAQEAVAQGAGDLLNGS